MRAISLIIFAVVVTARHSTCDQQEWYNFLVRFSLDPLIDVHGFFTMPRTRSEAINADWIEVDNGCNGSSNSKYPGTRMWRDVYNHEMILIFDKNGFIAGTQSVVPKIWADQELYDFEGSPAYNLEVIEGKEYYLTTAYFVDPNTICKGRTQAEFDAQGTGYTLHFQNGPTYKDLITIPTVEEGMYGNGDWFKHKCFVNMGDHFFMVDPKNPSRSCKDMFPVQLIFDHQKPQKLAGFVWQHFGAIPGERWEQPDEKAVNAIMKNPPHCVLEQASKGNLRTLHHYFLSHVETCLF